MRKISFIEIHNGHNGVIILDFIDWYPYRYCHLCCKSAFWNLPNIHKIFQEKICFCWLSNIKMRKIITCNGRNIFASITYIVDRQNILTCKSHVATEVILTGLIGRLGVNLGTCVRHYIVHRGTTLCNMEPCSRLKST